MRGTAAGPIADPPGTASVPLVRLAVGQRINIRDGELSVRNHTMTGHTRSGDRERLCEWASLIGDRLPEEYAAPDED